MASKGSTEQPINRRDLAKSYLLAKPDASNADVVKALGVSTRLVSMARSELRREGKLPKAFGDWTSRPAGLNPSLLPSPPAPANAEQVLIQGTADLLKKAEEAQAAAGHEFSIEDQLALCRRFANDPREGAQVRLAALTVYNKIKSEIAGRDELGPGKPLTEDDRITRLSLLCQALGLKSAVKAFEQAFGRKENDGPQADDPSAAPEVSDAIQAEGHDAGGSDSPPGEGEGGLGQGPGPEHQDQG